MLLGACTSARTIPPTPTTGPQPLSVPWRTVTLPTDPRGRDLIRAAAACSGHWYLSGAILTAEGVTTPAVWTSRNGVDFVPMPLRAVSFYGPNDTLYDIACRGGDVVAVGATNGGVHDNPRTSTWVSAGGGPLVEKPSGLGLYGGEDAIGVGPATAGTPGFLIVGARVDRDGGAGAAVWTSPDGVTFTLRDADPALESGDAGGTAITAAAPAYGGFIAVGSLTPPDSRLAARDPLAWTSSDGATWQRVTFPRTAADDPLINVVQAGNGMVAVGTDGRRFVEWTADAGGQGWRPGSHFGAIVVSSWLPGVPSLAPAGGNVYAVISNAAAYQLWRLGADPVQVALPETVPAAPVRSGPRTVVAAANGTDLMVAADDGTASHVWFTTAP